MLLHRVYGSSRELFVVQELAGPLKASPAPLYYRTGNRACTLLVRRHKYRYFYTKYYRTVSWVVVRSIHISTKSIMCKVPKQKDIPLKKLIVGLQHTYIIRCIYIYRSTYISVEYCQSFFTLH